MGSQIKSFSVVKANFQSNISYKFDCIPGVFSKIGLFNFNEVSHIELIPSQAEETIFEFNKNEFAHLFPVLCQGKEGENVTASIAIAWLTSKETNERAYGSICGLALNEDADFTIEKVCDLIINKYIQNYSKEYEIDDILTYTESVFAAQAHAVSMVGIVVEFD